MTGQVVIVGAGQAGFQAAVSLRENGYAGPVVLVGAEPQLPYQRPPLSKGFIRGEVVDSSLRFRPASFFAGRDITLRLGEAVSAINRTAGQVVLESGERLAYEHLVLATGARARTLVLPGADAANVFTLRGLADAQRLRAAAALARRIIVVGAGFIGLEFAASASALGARVLVLDAADRPMARAVSPAVSTYFTARHAAWGLEVECGASGLELCTENGLVTGVRVAGGSIHPCDLVVVGIGVVPNTALAEQAGLATENGIVADALCATADPAISAIGDCASVPMLPCARRMRLESVQAAVVQARTAAARLTGRAIPSPGVPWFWSDQGDAKLQIAGLAASADRFVQAGETDRFAVYGFVGGVLACVETVNLPAVHMTARKLLEQASSITPEDVSKPGFDPRRFLHAPEPTRVVAQNLDVAR